MVQLNKFHKGAVVLLIILILFIVLDNRVKVSGDNISLLANTKFKKSYMVEYKNPLKRFLKPEFSIVKSEDYKKIRVEVEKSVITLMGEGEPGEFSIEIKTKNRSLIRSINFNINLEDSDKDGFYDLVELDTEEDRESFINWFTSIAKSQFYNMSEGWNNIHRDCSGLITFSYKEALKKHDLKWLKDFSTLNEQRDVEKYNYPDIPILGVNCFNTASGFKPGANASSLLNYNMGLISKNPKDFKKGDILFYYDEEFEMPYHSMIYLGESGYVVYHTGPIDDDNSGEVRMVLLTDLLKHPDEKWHPKENNNKFLGGFRWHILM